jgi:hypothetical protein
MEGAAGGAPACKHAACRCLDPASSDGQDRRVAGALAFRSMLQRFKGRIAGGI